MDRALYVIVAFLCVLVICIAVLVVFFLKHNTRPRRRAASAVASASQGSPGSSSRSRMAARWANMEQGSLSRARKEYQNESPEVAAVEIMADGLDHPDLQEFGSNGGLSPRFHTQPNDHSRSSSLVGTGPNGTRTFLKGWFGLDEPTFSGFQVANEEKSMNGDNLPMSPPVIPGTNRTHAGMSRFPHHAVPLADDEDWETRSNRDSP